MPKLPRCAISLEGKLALLGVEAGAASSAALVAAGPRWLGSPWLAFLAIGPASRFRSPARAHAMFMRPIADDAAGGQRRHRQHEGPRLQREHQPAPTQPELAALVESYNGAGQLLRDERQSLYQRELLLDTVIQATPLAMVLTNANGRVVYSNLAARQTFLGGRKLEGLSFAELLAASPEPLRQAVAGEADTLFTIEGEGESEIYHLSQRALPAEQPVAPAVPAEAADARAVAPGSRDLEEGHPRDRARAQQLAGADLLARAFRPADRSSVPSPRSSSASSARSRSARSTCTRSSTATRASPSCRGRSPKRSTGRRSCARCRRRRRSGSPREPPAAARRVRSGADGAGADQPGQERAGGGRAGRQHRARRCTSTPAAGACRCSIAGQG